MKFIGSFSSHNGVAEWQRRELYEWATDLFMVPGIEIAYGATSAIRSHLRDELTNAGWSYNVRIDPNYDLTVTGRFRDLAFQIQTGNIARAIYDLIKLQHLYATHKIQAAAIAVPTKQAATIIGSNIANDERLWGEVNLFDRIITVPLMLISFE